MAPLPTVTLHAAEKEHNPHSLIPFLHAQPPYPPHPPLPAPFRILLAPLQQQIIMNLLWLESAIQSQTMAAWAVRDARKKVVFAFPAQSWLHIVSPSHVKLALNPTFKTSLRQALTGGGATGSFGVPAAPDDKNPSMSVETLDGYALERWETILHYMVSSGTGQTSVRPSKDVLFLLEQSGLMASHHGTLQITSAGFQFLLQSPHAQLWQLLLEYLRMAEARSMDLVEVLSFLFMLSTMELGREYATAEGASTTQTQQTQAQIQTHKAMLADLRDYGLVWTRKSSSKRFHPTRLATTLTSSSPPLPTSAGPGAGPKEGFIVLETNYRVYAYTDNPLQTAVLNLFVSLKYRFPNLVVGSITRESVKKALSSGISAEQIISYLIAHAHPQMRKNVRRLFIRILLPSIRATVLGRMHAVTVPPASVLAAIVRTGSLICYALPHNPLLPVTVQDQIRLWELERNRLKSSEGAWAVLSRFGVAGWADGRMAPPLPASINFFPSPPTLKIETKQTGYLYTAFASEADYLLVLNYAKQLDIVIWESQAKRCFFASTEGHPRIKAFIERRHNGGGGGGGEE
ncbi:RNA polymerase II transcription factor B subunit 2 [Mycena kentingensis (nom. inval.)]|nr:RNA polymerase II transcription factor B subunit 2 [Mycena kentingensis (nom. inval.)]